MNTFLENRKKKPKKNILTILFVTYIGILLIAGIFGDLGAIKNYELYKQNKILEGNVQNLEDENKGLRREIDHLTGNPRYIEKVAREELNMSREDEITFIFEDDEEPPKAEPPARGKSN